MIVIVTSLIAHLHQIKPGLSLIKGSDFLTKFEGSDEDRTRDLRFTRPTPYHLATAPTDI